MLMRQFVRYNQSIPSNILEMEFEVVYSCDAPNVLEAASYHNYSEKHIGELP